MRSREGKREKNNPYYDLFEDWELIVSSFLSQYGLRLSTREFSTVSWDEFCSLLSGISPETVLGRVVSIRLETYPERRKHFTSEQKRIWEEWQCRRGKKMTTKEFNQAMAQLEQMILAKCR